jgi:hypothetical protein
MKARTEIFERAGCVLVLPEVEVTLLLHTLNGDYQNGVFV